MFSVWTTRPVGSPDSVSVGEALQSFLQPQSCLAEGLPGTSEQCMGGGGKQSSEWAVQLMLSSVLLQAPAAAWLKLTWCLFAELRLLCWLWWRLLKTRRSFSVWRWWDLHALAVWFGSALLLDYGNCSFIHSALMWVSDTTHLSVNYLLLRGWNGRHVIWQSGICSETWKWEEQIVFNYANFVFLLQLSNFFINDFLDINH